MDHSAESPVIAPPSGRLDPFRYELRRYAKDGALIGLTVAIPAVLFTLFCLLFGRGIITGVPVTILDQDNSALSRTLTRAIGASSVMRIAHFDGTLDEVERDLRRGSVSGAFYFPHGMQREVKRGEQAFPVFYKNSQNVQVGNLLAREATAIFRTVNGGVLLQEFRAKGLTREQALGVLNPVTTDASVLYNPNFSYSEFLCPGLIFAQFQVMIMIAAILLFNRDYRNSRGGDRDAPPAGAPTVFLARSAPACLALVAVAVLVITVLFPLFGIRLTGPLVPTMGAILLFIAASFIPGILIGLLVPKAVSGLAMGILINMPAFIFSGFTFPLWAFPGPVAVLAHILPFTYFAPAFFQIALIGAPLSCAAHGLARLSLFVLVPLPAIAFLLSREAARPRAGA
jgi:ABC-2 type transport system permease protein